MRVFYAPVQGFPLAGFPVIVMSVKILLVQPPVEDFYDTGIRTYPLALLYVATRVRDIADVAILDARTGGKQHLPDSPFPELTPFYRSDTRTPFSFFGRYYRFGLTVDDMRSAIVRQRPDVVGIASMCSAYEETARETARVAKEVDPNIITVLGGTHATMFPEHLLRDANVDYCIRGEGETPFFELITCLTAGWVPDIVPGLCWRDGNNLCISAPHIEKDIDLVPDRRLLDATRYRIGRKNYTFLLASRGCPLSCGFCGKPAVPYRRRTIVRIEEEIEECARLGIEAIDFEDDMLNLDAPFFASVLNLLAGRHLTLSAMNGIYPNAVDVPTLQHMYTAGFQRLNFSLVDVAQSVLGRQHRTAHGSFLNLLPYLEGSSFLTEVHFIIGLPGQSPEGLLDVIIFLMEKRILLGPSVFYMAPGSTIYNTDEKSNDIPFSAMRSSFMLPFNPLFPRSVTFTLVKLVRFVNYIKDALDRTEGLTRLSDLLDGGGPTRNQHEASIITHLLRNKTFVCYDAKGQELRPEPVERQLVETFFRKAKGRTVKGYKTGNRLVVDA